MALTDPHKYRRGEPDFTMLVRSDNGQITHNVSFRKGPCAQAYVDLRQWCFDNGINFSDIVNSIIEPMLQACHHFARRDKEGNIIITLNFGDVMLEQVYHPRTPERNQFRPSKCKKERAAKRITLI